MNGYLKYCRKGLWATKAASSLPLRLSQTYEAGILSLTGKFQLPMPHVPNWHPPASQLTTGLPSLLAASVCSMNTTYSSVVLEETEANHN